MTRKLILVVSASVLVATALLLSLGFNSTARADVGICSTGSGAGQCEDTRGVAVDAETGSTYLADRGNNRIDVFGPGPAHAFAFSFGWGVASGAAELQSCGPEATPPTASCLRGLATGGAGSFSSLGDLAVDNDPTSPSHRDVYVLDGKRIQKFDPEGNFLLTFGGGVITGGASGTGKLTAGSTQIEAVKTTSKSFLTGQTITAAGIPAETKILALGSEKITLSKAAIASGTAVALSVAAGAGNVSVNETQKLTINSSDPEHPLYNFEFSTPNPSPSQAIVPIDIAVPPPASGPGSVQESFEGAANIGPGNVAVTGPTGGPYTIEFKGPRFADTDVTEIAKHDGVGNVSVATIQNGGGAKEVCTSPIAASCSAGTAGDGEGQFAEFAHLAVGPGGMVHMVDCMPVNGGPSMGGSCNNRLQKFSPSGVFIEELSLPQAQSAPKGLAVDSGGDFYVSFNNAIRKYDPAGNLLKALAVASEVGPLAIGSSDHLFAAERDSRFVIAEYDSAGNIVRRFGYDVLKSQPDALAPYTSAGGDIFSAEGGGVMYRAFPPPGPIVALTPCKAGPFGNTKATLNAEVNPEGKATSFKFEYLTDDQYKAGGFSNPGTKSSEEVVLSEVDYKLHDAAIQVVGLQPETTYHCRVVAENADSATPLEGVEGSFKTKEGFEFGPAWASEVGEEAATVNVEGNPLGIPAKGQVEYVTDAQYQANGFADALSAPAEELGFGAGEQLQLRSTTLTGLAPGTVYHYRLRVRNGTPPEGIICPERKLVCPQLEHTFKTHLREAGEADQRRWELVSPGLKNSAEVAIPGPSAGSAGLTESRFVRIQASAGSGEAVTYTSFTSFGDPKGAPGTSQYLSKRGEGGWTTENITPRGFIWFPLLPPYTGFSADLRFSAFKMTQPALTPNCRQGLESLYWRDNETGELHCLTPDEPGAPESPCLVYAGASGDGSRVFFAGRPEGGEEYTNSLYEWSEANGVKLVSVLPGGEPAPGTEVTGFGAGASRGLGENCEVTRRVQRHAVSNDGSRVFWTYAPDDESAPTQLYARIDGAETIQLDLKQPSGAAAGNGVFRGASADGSVVYFTDVEKLISGAKAENGKPDLYRYQIGRKNPLTDLTIGAAPGDVKGVVGISEEGSYVYFVAGAVLSEEPNKAGQKAEAGKNNLYLYHEGATTFIAGLAAPEDQGDWAASPRELSARVSPDGRHLAFLSIEAENLVGYDNTIAVGEHCQPLLDERVTLRDNPLCPQAFLYAADSGELSCASCNPSGARPLGPTLLPGWTNNTEGPRFLTDDGSRLFFQSFDKLAQADENDNSDVYEFERPGRGSCSEAVPQFDPASGGCRFLLSSGKSGDETYLVDASSDGRDVFISTRAQLVGWDVNENFDVYDFREGGGFPEPSPPPPGCISGESCKLPPVSPAQPTSPATQTFTSPGNPRPCKKGFVRKGKKCIKKRQGSRKQNKKHQKKGSSKGRAVR